jgi:hypothetical protein
MEIIWYIKRWWKQIFGKTTKSMLTGKMVFTGYCPDLVFVWKRLCYICREDGKKANWTHCEELCPKLIKQGMIKFHFKKYGGKNK